MKAKIWALALGMIALGTAAKAQDEGTTFGIRAGVNFQNLNGEDEDGRDLDNKLKTGFHVGVNAEIPVAPEFYLQPGVLFSTKGAKSDDPDAKVNISYIEVPINFVYKPELGTGKLILGIGPYVGIGIGGKVKPDNGSDVDIEFKNDVDLADFLTGTLYMKRLDFGGNLLAGYEFSNKLSFQLNAQLGMSNLVPKIEGEKPDGKLKNTGFGVSLGYRF